MKTGAKIGIVAVIIIVLLMCCCLASVAGWMFMLGPLSYQTSKADSLVAAANKNYKTVKDSSNELNQQIEDFGTDFEADTATQDIKQMEDDLLTMESKTQEMIDELDAADKKLADAKKLRLPDWYIEYIYTLTKRDAAASDGLTALKNGIAETRKLVGSQTYVIDAVNRQAAAWTQVETAVNLMTGGDIAGAQAQLAAANSSLAAADTALTTANETMKSQDVEDLISFNQTCLEFLALLNQFLTAAAAGDLNSMTTLESQISSKYTEIEKESNALGINDDYTAWFESVVTKYEDEYEAKMKEADDLDAKAKTQYAKKSA